MIFNGAVMPAEIGRGGIKLPEYEWRACDPSYQMDNFLDYFHAFWEANDVDLTMTSTTNTRRDVEQIPLFKEQVLPADTTRPTTLVRVTYQPKSQSNIDLEMAIDRRRNSYDQNGVHLGVEKHELLVPPLGVAGSLSPVMSLVAMHDSGGRSCRSSVFLDWQSKGIFAGTYETPYSDSSNIHDWRSASVQTVAEGLQPILHGIIAYMS